MSERIKENYKPPCGRELGWIYPAAFRYFSWTLKLSPARFAKGSQKWTDNYVLGCFLGEILIFVLISLFPVLPTWIKRIFFFLLGFRVFDMMNVLFYSLIRPSLRKTDGWASRGRTVILGFFNLIQIFVIFASVFSLLPEGSFHSDVHAKAIDSLYLSFVTGIHSE